MFKFAETKDKINCNLKNCVYCFEYKDKTEEGEVTVTKIGQTSKKVIDRLNQYKEKISNIYWIQTDNFEKIEKIVLKKLKNKVSCYKGNEYFLCKVETVKNEIEFAINNFNSSSNKANSIVVDKEVIDKDGNLCKQCNKYFDSLRGLNIHISRCRDESFECKLCDKVYVQKVKLQEHFETRLHKDSLKIFELEEKCKEIDIINQEKVNLLEANEELQQKIISLESDNQNLLNKTSNIQKLQLYLMLVLEKNKFYEKELEKQRFIVSDLLKEQQKMFCELFKDLKTK